MNIHERARDLAARIRQLRALLDDLADDFDRFAPEWGAHANVPTIVYSRTHAGSVHDRLLRAMAARPDHVFSGPELAAALHLSDTEQIRTAVHRLIEAGSVARVSHGRYRVLAVPAPDRAPKERAATV